MNTQDIALLTSIFAAFTALAAWRNSEIAKRAQKNQRMNLMLEYRYSGNYFNAKKELRNWYDNNKENIGKKFLEYRNTPDGKILDTYRNTFLVYYQTIFDLHKAKLIKRKEMKAFVNKTDLILLYHIVKPIQDSIGEKILDLDIPKINVSKENDIFIFFNKLYFSGYIDGSGIKINIMKRISDFLLRR